MRGWISLALLGAAVSGFFGVTYLFSVPQICGCRAQIDPQLFKDVEIFDNSVVDSNSISLAVGTIEGGEELRICYSEKPLKGGIWSSSVGLSDKGCEFINRYHLQQISSRKSDVASVITFEIAQNAQQQDRKKARGALRIDRKENSCTFSLENWEIKATGEAKCHDPVFYFNLWSWFPQTVELFYTRAFFWLHTETNPSSP